MDCGKVFGDAGHQKPGTFLRNEETVPRERVSMRKLLELLRLHFVFRRNAHSFPVQAYPLVPARTEE